MSLELNGTNKIVHDNLNQNIKDLLMPKNWIINGGFDVWQRGTSQTSSGYGSDDRWNNYNLFSTKTHSQQAFTVGQTEVPNNPTYFSRTIVTSGGTSSSRTIKYQKIEDVTKLSGKTVSLSFWAKADSSKKLSIEIRQNFNGGSTDLITDVKKFTLTSSWQRFTRTFIFPSISGKTFIFGHNVQLIFWFDAGIDYNSRTDSLGNQSGTFDIANVSLVEGSVPVEWQTEAYADVLDKCLRYYQFGLEGVVGQCGGSTSLGGLAKQFKKEMRVAPTISYLGNVIFYVIGIGTYSINGTTTSYATTTKGFFINNQPISGSPTAGRVATTTEGGGCLGYAYDAEL